MPWVIDREAILAICNQAGTPLEVKERLSPYLVVAAAGAAGAGAGTASTGAGAAPAPSVTLEGRETQSQMKSELLNVRLEEKEGATTKVRVTKGSA